MKIWLVHLEIKTVSRLPPPPPHQQENPKLKGNLKMEQYIPKKLANKIPKKSLYVNLQNIAAPRTQSHTWHLLLRKIKRFIEITVKLHTWSIESTSRICDKNLLPKPCNQNIRNSATANITKPQKLQKIRIWSTGNYKVYRQINMFHLPLTGSLHEASNVDKLYGCWDSSLRFAEFWKYIKTWIRNSNNPYIRFYCTKGKICSLSFTIFDLDTMLSEHNHSK